VVPRGAEGNAANMHMAQSGIKLWCLSALLLSLDTNFITPPEEHTNSMALGDTKGDAEAIPMEKTNHTSKRRATNLACLSECIRGF
jgi:hypothetical protein